MDYSRFASRKFIVALLTIIATVLGVDPEVMLPLSGVIVAYLAGQSYVDSKSK